MKKIQITLSVILLFSCSLAFAEGKGKTDWAEQAALSYEKKANHAADRGQAGNAAIYKRLAEIKRESRMASKQGKKFDWSEYHKLKGQLDHGHNKKHAKDKKDQKQAKDKKYQKKQKDYKKDKKQSKTKKGY